MQVLLIEKGHYCIILVGASPFAIFSIYSIMVIKNLFGGGFVNKRFNQNSESNRDFFGFVVWPPFLLFWVVFSTLGVRFYDARSCKGSSKAAIANANQSHCGDEWFASSTWSCQSVCSWKYNLGSTDQRMQILVTISNAFWATRPRLETRDVVPLLPAPAYPGYEPIKLM